MASSRHLRTPVLLLTAALLTVACQHDTVYNHYQHTPLAGWERNDTLTFTTEALDEGTYKQEVGVRISADYPFTRLILIVEQKALKAGDQRTDTLSCTLFDAQGNAKGRGVSHYQSLFHLNTLHVQSGDRLLVAIRHDMKREILPGIADIGVRLSRTPESSLVQPDAK